MASRLGVWAALGATWLAGTVLGVASAALRTDAGRRLVADAAVSFVNARIDGTMSVAGVGGSFFDGLALDGVAIRGVDGRPLLEVERLQLRYRLNDLLSGRIVLGQLVLTRPRVTLVQTEPGGPFNLDDILPGRDPARPAGPRPYVAFRDVRIERGAVTIVTPAEPGPGRGAVGGADAPQRVRRIEDLDARFPFVRLSSPFPFERAVAVEVAVLAARLSDPELVVTAAQGVASIFADSVTLDLTSLALPSTRAQLAGTLSWPADTLLLDLRVRAAHAVADEVRGLVPELPAGIAGRGDFTIRSLSGDVLEVIGERLELEGVAGGGRLRGRVGVRLGPGEVWAQRDTRVEVRNFDLEYLRALVLDTLPVAGRLTGRITLDGPQDRLALGLSATLRDSLVAGWPETSVDGAGIVRLGGADVIAFDSFTVRHADVSLASVQRLVPAVALDGRLRGRGVLHGPWRHPTFAGELRHQDPPGPESVARGTVTLDTRGDTLGVWAEADLDPLDLDGLASSFAVLGEVGGRLVGRLALHGYLDSLGVAAVLRGQGGAIDAAGALTLTGDDVGAHALDVVLRHVDLQTFSSGLPESRLFLHARLAGAGFTTGARWQAALELDSSAVRGVWIDSARAVARVGEGALTLDTLRVFGYAIRGDARGSFGLEAPRRGVLTALLRVDSIGVLEPFLADWLGPAAGDTVPPAGTVALDVRVDGVLDDYVLSGTFDVRGLRRAGVAVTRAQGRGAWESAARRVRLDASVDSAALPAMSVAALDVAIRGTPDALEWHAAGRFGRDGAFMGGGRWGREDGGHVVRLDSAGVRLATSAWFADTGAVVAVSDSGVDVERLAFSSDRGTGAVAVRGRLPFTGPADLTAEVRALPVPDLWVLLQRPYEDTDGEVSGTLRMGGTARAPEINATLALRDGRFGTFRAPHIEGEARYRDHRLHGAVTLWRAGERILGVTYEVPLDLALAGAKERRLPGELSVQAVAAGVDLSFFEALTPAVRRTGGTLDADFGIAGSWERPRLTGRVRVRDGAASFPALGVRHEGLNAVLRLVGDTIAVESLAVRSGQGTARVEGYVRLEELSRPVLDLRITGRDFRSIDVRDFLSLTATAELQLRGPLFQAALTGRGTASRGVLYFADLLRKDIVNLEDPLFRQFVDTTLIERAGLGPEFQNRFLDSLRIDSLRIEMGSDAWLRSSEANIQLAGAVTVSKVRDRYRYTGTLETPRGTYRLELLPAVTREFAVTRGQVRYFGTPDLNADLDIEARHVVRVPRRDDVTVLVHIGGTLYEPRLTLSSDIRPAISETEIISYLLFGAPSVPMLAAGRGAENRRLEQQMLENVLGAVTGQIESQLIADLGIPLDYLQIRPVGGGVLGGTEIAVGKQFTFLGTTAFLTASPQICPRQEFVSIQNVGASLEFQLSRQWLLAASVDPLRRCEVQTTESAGYQLGVDLFWERRY